MSALGIVTRGYFGGGSGTAAEAPTITVISPTPGVTPGQPGGFSARWSIARLTPIVIDIDGDDLDLACIVARYPSDGGELERVVYRRGALRPGFVINSAAEQVTATKLRLTVLPSLGWPSFTSIAEIEFDVDASAGGAISDEEASS